MKILLLSSLAVTAVLLNGCGISSTPLKSLTGTGSDAMASAQRSALGLGDMAVQDASDLPPLTATSFNGPLLGDVVTSSQPFITSIPQLNSVGTITSGTWNGTLGAISGANLTNLNATNLASGLVPSARISGNYASITGLGTITSGTWQGSQIADTYLATISTAGKVANSATSALASATANSIVLRDSSGDFEARNISATSFIGQVSTATQNSITSIPYLTTVGTINSGVWSGSFGAVSGANLTSLNASNLATGTVSSGVISGNYPNITGVGTLTSGVWNGAPITDSYLATISTAGKVANSATTATALNTASTIVARNAQGHFASETLQLKKQNAKPYNCDDASQDGIIALHSNYYLCVCKFGTGWVQTFDGTTVCTGW